MAVPTEKEYGLLAKFRENIKDLTLTDDQQEDMFLLSWIRARENDLTKAEDMLRKSLKWRGENDIDNIFDWTAPSIYEKEFPYDITGNDAGGSPVLTCSLGLWDVRKIIEFGQRETYIRFVDQIYSKLFAKLKEEPALKKGQTQFAVVIDMKGLSLRQFTSPSTVETVLETFRRFEANFPETLKSAHVVNAPRIFPMAFAIVKPLLSGRTLNKIHIYSSDAKKWKPILLSTFPAHTLPTEFGGTFASSQKKGAESDPMSTEVDADSDGGLIEANIAAGGKLLLEFDVESENSILQWEFKTDKHDIGFSITYGANMEPVYPYEKQDASAMKVHGKIVCERVGTYTLAFDNSYSRLRSKTVRYLATVVSSLTEEVQEQDDAGAGDTCLDSTSL